MARQRTICIPCDVVAIAADTCRGKVGATLCPLTSPPTLPPHRLLEDILPSSNLKCDEHVLQQPAKFHQEQLHDSDMLDEIDPLGVRTVEIDCLAKSSSTLEAQSEYGKLNQGHSNRPPTRRRLDDILLENVMGMPEVSARGRDEL